MSDRNYRSTSKSEEPPMLGLHSVIGCDNPHRSGDVIFIHGLAGHAWGTWHSQDQRDLNDSDFWLTWLREDLIKIGIDIGVWTFGYEDTKQHVFNLTEKQCHGLTKPAIYWSFWKSVI